MMTGYNNHQTELDLNNLHKEITEKLQVCKIILLIEEVRAIFCCSECFLLMKHAVPMHTSTSLIRTCRQLAQVINSDDFLIVLCYIFQFLPLLQLFY